MASSMMGNMSSAAEIWVSPFSLTMAPGALPVAKLSSKTSLATFPVIVFASMRSSTSARWLGERLRPSSPTSLPASLSKRLTSPSAQFAAALARDCSSAEGLTFTTASKKSAMALVEVSCPAS